MSITTSFRAVLFLLFVTFTYNVWAFTDTGDVLEVGNDLLIGNTAYGKRDYGSEGDTKETTRLGNALGVRGELFAFSYTSTVLMEIGNQGEGYFSGIDGIDGNLTTPRLVLGKEASAHGQIRILSGNISGTGPGSNMIVGDAGTGSIQLGESPFLSGVAQFELVTLGAQATGNGSIGLENGGLFVGHATAPGHLVVGNAGTGSISVNSRASLDVSGVGSTVTLGAAPGSKGTIASFQFGSFGIYGDNSTLIIGEAGSGWLWGEHTAFGFGSGAARRSFVAMQPGSTGEVTVGLDSTFLAGDILRIGLDAQDNPGGTGRVDIFDYATLQAGLIKVGPNGSITAEFAPNSIVGNIENQGTLSVLWTVSGNIVNSGLVTSYRNMFGHQTQINNYTQIASGTTRMYDFGSASGVNGRILASGTADLDGVIEVGFDPSMGLGSYNINLITANGGLTAAPSLTVVTSGLPPYLRGEPAVGPNTLDLRIVAADLDADLAVTQTDAPDPVKVGENLVYNVLVINNGPGVAQNFVLNGAVSAGATFVSVAPSYACTHSMGSITCNVAGGLYPPDPYFPDANTFRMLLTVRPETAGTLTNSVTVSSSAMDPNPANNSGSEATTVLASEADLAVAATDNPDPVTVNSELLYGVAITNNGPEGAGNVNMTADLPDSVLFVSASPSQGSCTGTDPVLCNLGTLATGANATVQVRVKPQTVGDISSSMTVGSSSTDPDAGNNTAVVNTTVEPQPLPVADLALNMTDNPDPANRNKELLYRLTVVNNGPDTATDVAVTDVLPDIMTLLSATPSQGSCAGAAPVVCNLGMLAPGGTATVDILVKPDFGGTWTNAASVNSAAQDPNAGNNNATETTTVRGRPSK